MFKIPLIFFLPEQIFLKQIKTLKLFNKERLKIIIEEYKTYITITQNQSKTYTQHLRCHGLNFSNRQIEVTMTRSASTICWKLFNYLDVYFINKQI